MNIKESKSSLLQANEPKDEEIHVPLSISPSCNIGVEAIESRYFYCCSLFKQKNFNNCQYLYSSQMSN